jgi:hypothetical protein
MSFGLVPAVKERNMRGPLSEDRREPWSELKVADLLSALAFGASFEEIANFLIDNPLWSADQPWRWCGTHLAHMNAY